jgi:hypothetical protein
MKAAVVTGFPTAHGDWPVTPSLPVVPGYEGTGYIESAAVPPSRRATTLDVLRAVVSG